MKDNKEINNCCGHHHDHDHDHECDCNEVGTIVLTLDDDSEIECMVIGIFDFEDKEYIALLPISEEDGDDIFIYEYKELDDEDIELNIVEDEDLFIRVASEFENLYIDEE